MNKICIFSLAALLFAGVFQGCNTSRESQSATIEVENTLNQDRQNETVELCWKALSSKIPGLQADSVIVLDTAGKEIPSQVIFSEDKAPRKLIFQANIKRATKESYTIKKGAPAPYEPKTFGRYVPERKDDFTWESDRIAFRMYGPALQATGEISSGIDIWSKRTRELIINTWYNHMDYHKDHGQGCDFYKVGPSLGAGGIAPVVNNKLTYSKNWARYNVLANGPIRTIFQLEYDPWTVNGEEITETKTISIDAGSNLNRIEVIYSNKKEMDCVVGIIKRKEEGHTIMEDGVMGYWQPALGEHGHTGVGVIFTKDTKVAFSNGEVHYRAQVKTTPKDTIVYYQGGGWDKSGDFSNSEDWFHYLKTRKACLDNPLKVTIR